jgi:hypothetical protein
MSKHVLGNPSAMKKSFKAASLKLDPSLIVIACHLARIAAEDDYDAFKNGQDSYNLPEMKGGPS